MNAEGTGPVPDPGLGLDEPATWCTFLGNARFVHVTCNAVPAAFLLDESAVVCGCAACTAHGRPSGEQLISPTEFERHAGLGATRKWRHSIKVTSGQPGRSEGSAMISIGRWLDEQNAAAAGAKANASSSAPSSSAPKGGGWRAQQREKQVSGSGGPASQWPPHLHTVAPPSVSPSPSGRLSDSGQPGHVWSGSMRKIPSAGALHAAGAPLVMHTTMVIHNPGSTHPKPHSVAPHPPPGAVTAPTPAGHHPATHQQPPSWQMPPPTVAQLRAGGPPVTRPPPQQPDRGSGLGPALPRGRFGSDTSGGSRRMSAGDAGASRGPNSTGSMRADTHHAHHALHPSTHHHKADGPRGHGGSYKVEEGRAPAVDTRDQGPHRPGLSIKVEADVGAGGGDGGPDPHARTSGGQGNGGAGPSGQLKGPKPAVARGPSWLTSPVAGKAAWEIQALMNGRIGPQYQAAVPTAAKERPQGGSLPETAGQPGPSEQEALHLAAGVEKASADALPRDAVEDSEEGVMRLTTNNNVSDYQLRSRRGVGEGGPTTSSAGCGSPGEGGGRKRSTRAGGSKGSQSTGGDAGEGEEGAVRPLKRSRAASRSRLSGGRPPTELQVTTWRLSTSNTARLHISVFLDGQVFTGVLSSQQAHATRAHGLDPQHPTAHGGRVPSPRIPTSVAVPSYAPQRASQSPPRRAGAVAAAAAAAATAAAMLRNSRSRANRLEHAPHFLTMPLWATLASSAAATQAAVAAAEARARGRHRSRSPGASAPRATSPPPQPSGRKSQQHGSSPQHHPLHLQGAAMGGSGGGKRLSALITRAVEHREQQQLRGAEPEGALVGGDTDPGSTSSWGPDSDSEREEKARARRPRGAYDGDDEDQQGADIMMSLLSQGNSQMSGEQREEKDPGGRDAAVAWQHAAWAGTPPSHHPDPLLMPVIPAAYDSWLMHHFQQHQQQQLVDMVGMHMSMMPHHPAAMPGHSTAMNQPLAMPQQSGGPSAASARHTLRHMPPGNEGAAARPGKAWTTQGVRGSAVMGAGGLSRAGHASGLRAAGAAATARAVARMRTSHRAHPHSGAEWGSDEQEGGEEVGEGGEEGLRGGSTDSEEEAVRRRQRRRRQQQRMAAQAAAAAAGTTAGGWEGDRGGSMPRAVRPYGDVQLPSRPVLHNPYAPGSSAAEGSPGSSNALAKALREEGEEEAAVLGGTTGLAGRTGRCAVCVIQRKGKCGTDSAPRKCLRRQLQAAMEGDEGGKGA